jgi:hypothetical protein
LETLKETLTYSPLNLKRAAQFLLPITSLFKERGLDWIVEEGGERTGTGRSPRLGAILACSGLKYRQKSKMYAGLGGTAPFIVNLADLSNSSVLPTKKKNRNLATHKIYNRPNVLCLNIQRPKRILSTQVKSPPKSRPCSLSATRFSKCGTKIGCSVSHGWRLR